MVLEFLQKCPFTLKRNRILKKYQLVKQYKVFLPTRESWCIPGKIGNRNVGIWYTEGAGIAASLVEVYIWTKGQPQGEYSNG